MSSDHRLQLAVRAAALTLFAAGSAALADTPPAAPGAASAVQTFPNVTVVTPTAEERARWSQLTAPTAGQRAYIDPATGKFREQNADDRRQEAQQQAMAEAAAKKAGKAAVSATPRTLHLPNGAVAMRVDESTMVYSVARRAEDGNLVQDCVAGPDEASQLVKKDAPPRRTDKEHADER